MDKLRAVKFFIEVSRTENFSRAAKQLGVPASSISRRILDLENELGVTLFHRSTRVVKLTELGALYLEQIEPAIVALNLADEMIGQHSEAPAGLLKITAGPDYGRFRLMPALKKMKRRYPNIICDVELTDEIFNLAQSEVDIAIRATSSLPERSIARKLTDGRFILVASPGYLNRHGMPQTADDLQNHIALYYRLPNGILSWQAQMENGWRELSVPPGLICNQGDTLLDEALAGNGIAMFARWGIREELAKGDLIHIVLNDAKIAASRNENPGIYLLYHRPKYALSKIRVAVDFLLSELVEK
ncbi:LysR family transcriptional regulator [Parasphingorhabdus sp.]|uniref:LysR family transcriptional regulator n=1 Tax=Parasphingorhabdus sp. TaxID=2709688 RepID=UPI0032655833